MFEIEVRGAREGGSGDTPVGSVRAQPRVSFPLLPEEVGAASAALALHFSQATTRLDRVRFLTGRAWELIRTGQVPLLLRAAARQVPRLARVGWALLGRPAH